MKTEKDDADARTRREIDDELIRLECKLQDLKLRVGAEVHLGGRGGDALGFGKVGGEWILYVKNPSGNRKELLKASFPDRILAVSKAATLCSELFKASQQLAAVHGRALECIKRLNDQLEDTQNEVKGALEQHAPAG